MTQRTLINLLPNEFSQKLHYYPFLVELNKCDGSCNTRNNLSNKAYVPKRTEDLNLSVSNIITGTNESKTSTKRVSCESKCKFDGRKYNSNQSGITINATVSATNVKYVKREKYFTWNLHVVAKMVNVSQVLFMI